MQTVNKPLRPDTSADAERMGKSLLECIGNTPLLRLERIAKQYPNAEFFAKAEWANPGGSVKDRPALEMIRDAERTGRLRPGQMILDATSKITPHVESGEMRMLLITNKIPELPNVPTLPDLGYKQELFSSWFAFCGPSGLPEEVNKALVSAIEKAIKHP